VSILITGGAGYIGSHTLIELSNAGEEFVVYDNLSNASKEALKRVEQTIHKPLAFIEGDIEECYAKPNLAKTLLGWETTKNIEQLCKDSWHWQNKNPHGYEK